MYTLELFSKTGNTTYNRERSTKSINRVVYTNINKIHEIDVKSLVRVPITLKIRILFGKKTVFLNLRVIKSYF